MFAIGGFNKSQSCGILFPIKQGGLDVWNAGGEVGKLQAAQVPALALHLTSSKISNGLCVNPADILALVLTGLSAAFDTGDTFILIASFCLSFCNTNLPAFLCSLAPPSQSVL